MLKIWNWVGVLAVGQALRDTVIGMALGAAIVSFSIGCAAIVTGLWRIATGVA